VTDFKTKSKDTNGKSKIEENMGKAMVASVSESVTSKVGFE
jgi:hypothetical protein